jgi:hypothetical protein
MLEFDPILLPPISLEERPTTTIDPAVSLAFSHSSAAAAFALAYNSSIVISILPLCTSTDSH